MKKISSKENLHRINVREEKRRTAVLQTAEQKEQDAEKQRLKQAERERKRVEKLRSDKEKARIREQRRAINEQKRAEKQKTAALRYAQRQAFFNKLKSKLRNRRGAFDYKNVGMLPRVEILCKGDGASVASSLSAAQIDMFDFMRDGAFVRFKLKKKDLRKAIAILDKMCYTYTIGDGYGVGRLGSFVLARLGLIAGAVVSAVCLNISYGYIWRVEIDGNENLSTAAIESILRSNGVNVGLKKRDVLNMNVAASVSKMEGVVDATTEIVGTTLYVYVLESDDFTVHGAYGAYSSKYDATVTRIVVRSGSATVNRGDVVKCGDILADGSEYSTTGELLYVGECDADIYGDVSLTFIADVTTEAIEFRRTGNSIKKTQMQLFGLDIFKPVSPYDSYESVSTTSNYDVLIPLYITTHEYFETQAVRVERDIDEIAQEFARSKIEEMNFAGDFKSSYTVKPLVSGLYSIHLFLSGETLISSGIDQSEYVRPPETDGETQK